MNALEAIDLWTRQGKENYCVTCIFDRKHKSYPGVRHLLKKEKHQEIESEMMLMK